MEINKIIDMKTQNSKAIASYKKREIFLNKIYIDSQLVEVVDLINGDIYTLHSSKIDAPIPCNSSHLFE